MLLYTMRKKKLKSCIVLLVVMLGTAIMAQTGVSGSSEPVDEKIEAPINSELDPGIKDSSKIDSGLRDTIKRKFFNVNLDGTILYGMYNNIFTSFYIAQDFERFSYQLNAGLRRSNDFDYQNSSYYEGEIGFTGNADFTETWKCIPQLEVQNESHGMFDNTFYSREEKDKIIVNVKNEYKPTPSRWDFNLGGGQYVHRLISAQSSGVDKSDFYQINGEIGWEYIWSAANKFRLDAKSVYYNYATSDPDDIHVSTEFLWGFKIIEYLKIEPGVFYIWNADGGHFPSGRLNVSTSGINHVSLELSYVYDMVPFKPEEYYEQKYIKPEYDLSPGNAHHVSFKSMFNFKFSSEKKSYLKTIKFKTNLDFEENSRIYNYYPLPENVLSAYSLHGMSLDLKSDLVIDFKMYNTGLSFDMRYRYRKFFADENITYTPEHVAGILLKLTTKWVDVEWDNMYHSTVYVNPLTDTILDWFILGSVEVQVKVLETFSLYAKVDNIYNTGFSYRYGYPEPGAIFLAGLKIII